MTKVSTLSKSALKNYNSIYDLKINIHSVFESKDTVDNTSYQIPITVHNRLGHVGLPVLHLSNMILNDPTMASLF